MPYCFRIIINFNIYKLEHTKINRFLHRIIFFHIIYQFKIKFIHCLSQRKKKKKKYIYIYIHLHILNKEKESYASKVNEKEKCIFNEK